jgi:hypothetical protein
MRCMAVVFTALILTACTTLSLQGRVTRFHALEPAPKSYVVVPDDGQDGSLEFRTYAALLKERLTQHGWREATIEAADVAIFLQYQIGQGRDVTFSYPIFGSVPTGTATTTGTVTTYGNMSTINTTTTQQSRLGVVGTGTGSRTVYDRAVRVTMFSLPGYREQKRMEALYEGEIRSSGSTGDLPIVMPALLQGLFSDFPGKSGTTQEVSIPIHQ